MFALTLAFALCYTSVPACAAMNGEDFIDLCLRGTVEEVDTEAWEAAVARLKANKNVMQSKE
jgi:hypothetical protein